VYRSYGLSPIDTPGLEYLEILTGKGSDETDKQLYQFEDAGGRRVGMRFDLTVPLARFVAQHANELGLPFKRYHIATVWRGENTQRGRYREFMQCDFDTIGTKSLAADIETALVIHDLFQALGISDFTLHINNRLVLSGLLEKLSLADSATQVLRAIDKLAKIGPEKVVEEMQATFGATAEQASEVLALAGIEGSNEQILVALDRLVAGNERGQEGVGKLRELLKATTAAGIDPQRIKIAPSIARGLDYYTGTIYETFLNRLPQIGSVCSGGRYDNLAGLYTNQELPGVGASLGLDRLLAALEELELVQKVATPAPVFIAQFDAAHLSDYLQMAAALRSAGIGVELYPDAKKLAQQLQYADRRGFSLAIVAGENEFASGECQVKELANRQSHTVRFLPKPDELVDLVTRLLAN
jgi:histidyl-tRNA synthetase